MTRHSGWRESALAVAAITVASAAARCQDVPPSNPTAAVEQFTTKARDGTRRYQSQDAAIADGYKRFGVEFPTMGEHWISAARIGENTFEPDRPSVLIYATIDGAARLVAVGYTRLVSGREPPPALPAFADWHEHNGGVAEESLPTAHHRTSTSDGDATSPRLFVMHAWIWSQNPDGVFATNNWSLPLARLGVSVPEPNSPDALRALALAGDVGDYHLLVLRTAVGLSSTEAGAAGSVLDTYHARATHEAASVRVAGRLTPDVSQRLTVLWDALWADLERALPARVDRLRALRRTL
jgi:hypothetical protein